MNHFKSIILNFLLGSILISCHHKVDTCRNESLLYPSQDSIPVFELKHGMDALYTFIDSFVKVNIRLEPSARQELLILRDSIDYLCKLNPIEYPDYLPPCIRGRSKLEVLVNWQGMLLVEGDVTPLSALREIWTTFQTNEGKDPTMSVSPEKAVLMLGIDSTTQMDSLNMVLHEIYLARNEIIHDYARRRYDTSFCSLSENLAMEAVERYPLHIIISRMEKGWFDIPLPQPLPIVGNEG